VHLDPPGAPTVPRPQWFFWLPIDGQRHAARIHDRHLPSGKLITTLCGRQLTRIRVTDTEWLWPSCLECWSAAEARVGLRA
jgi:zinc finger protein